jgi:hypothetical protein
MWKETLVAYLKLLLRNFLSENVEYYEYLKQINPYLGHKSKQASPECKLEVLVPEPTYPDDSNLPLLPSCGPARSYSQA